MHNCFNVLKCYGISGVFLTETYMVSLFSNEDVLFCGDKVRLTFAGDLEIISRQKGWLGTVVICFEL